MGSHTKKPRADSPRVIMDWFRRLVQGLRLFDREAEGGTRLSAAQLFVLAKLAEAPASSVNDLARRTHTDQSSVSVIASRLVERGLASRKASPKDARRVALTVTSRGRQILRHAPPAAQDRLVGAIESLTPSQRATLGRLLEKVLRQAGLAEEPAGMFFEESDRR